MARRIVWVGVPLLLLVALCPKVLALFVLTPAPVKAAMLLYVAGFLMGQGCQLLSARLLDTRRMMIVAMEYCKALGVGRFYLTAQVDKLGLYEKLGFATFGPQFIDAGIPHLAMKTY